jgi:hypothetical protein
MKEKQAKSMSELQSTEKALEHVMAAYLASGGLFSKWYVKRKKKDSLRKARGLLAEDLEKNKGYPKLADALRNIDAALGTWNSEIGVDFGSDEFLKLVQEENESWKKAAELLTGNNQGRIAPLVKGWYNQTLAHIILNEDKWKDGSKTMENAAEEFYKAQEYSLTLDMIYRASLIIIEHTRHRDRGAKIMAQWAERFEKDGNLKLSSKGYYLAGELFSQKARDPKQAYSNYLLSAKKAWKSRYPSKVVEASMEVAMAMVDRAFSALSKKILRR